MVIKLNTPAPTYTDDLSDHSQTWGGVLENLDEKRKRHFPKQDGAVEVSRTRTRGQTYWTKTYVAAREFKHFTSHEFTLLNKARDQGLIHCSTLAKSERIAAEDRESPVRAGDKFLLVTRHKGPDVNFWLEVSRCRAGEGIYGHIFVPPLNFLRLIRGLLVALKELHDHGFVHLDLHPGNWALPADVTIHRKSVRIQPKWAQAALIDLGYGIHRDNTPALYLPQRVINDDGSSNPRYSSRLRYVLLEVERQAKGYLHDARPQASNDDLERLLIDGRYNPTFWSSEFRGHSNPLELFRTLDWREDLYQLGYWLKRIRHGDEIQSPVRMPSDIHGPIGRCLLSLPERLIGYETASDNSPMPHAALIAEIDAALDSGARNPSLNCCDEFVIKHSDYVPVPTWRLALNRNVNNWRGKWIQFRRVSAGRLTKLFPRNYSGRKVFAWLTLPTSIAMGIWYFDNQAADFGNTAIQTSSELKPHEKSTIHNPTQIAVSEFLKGLSTPQGASEAGLYGPGLLSPENDLTKIAYSFTLYENTREGSLLRVHAENIPQPFDINSAVKYEMGSSAKLRTLVTYLQLVEEMHNQYSQMGHTELLRVPVNDKDALLGWAIQYLVSTKDKSLSAMLNAAMSRGYSADSGEAFYTGGKEQRFVNANKKDDHKVMDLWEATRKSVNLPFIRLMRDIVNHLIYRAPSTADQLLEDVNDPRRQAYLIKYAEMEGRTLLNEFWKKYRGLNPQQIEKLLFRQISTQPEQIAAAYRYLKPEESFSAFMAFMKSRAPRAGNLRGSQLHALYSRTGANSDTLAERAKLIRINPMELWLAAHLQKHPGADWKKLVVASSEARVSAYEELFKSSNKNVQDLRILSLLEIEAFQEIHRRWRQMGYPFDNLNATYATAIGASGDSTDGIVKLIGMITNNGNKVDLASNNQVEVQSNEIIGVRIFHQEVANIIKTAIRKADILDYTSNPSTGTGLRLQLGGIPSNELEGPNRAAVFAYYLGDRFFGTLSIIAQGTKAGDYSFTHGLNEIIANKVRIVINPLANTNHE